MSNMDFLRAKAEGRKLSMATCYDYTFARLVSKRPIDGILVGDSAAMVMHNVRSQSQERRDFCADEPADKGSTPYSRAGSPAKIYSGCAICSRPCVSSAFKAPIHLPHSE